MTDHLRVPNVDLGDPIGNGSFGRVFRGRHRTLEVDVAVKFVGPDAVGNVDGALHEARLMARLDHPNLVRIFDAGRSNGSLYLVLELMDGTCSTSRPLPADRAVDVTRQLLAGLQSLHDARILHRDIKPANCLVRTRDGRVKLADLGIAVEDSTRGTRPHDLAGTLPYMAPELFEAPPRFGPASDLYALGRTMECLLLARDPFPQGSTGAVLAWIQEGHAPRIGERRPDVPAELSRLIDRLCARSVADRPAAAAEAIATLTARATPTVIRSADDRTALLVGSWVLGTEIPGDANFHKHAVTHLRTGVAGRLALLKQRCPLSSTSPLILASAERASRLSHPGIAEVVDWGLHADRAYVVTRSQGRALQALVESSGPIGEFEAVRMTRDLADALAYLHGAGLVYQVVNPLFALLASDARRAQLAWPMFCVANGSSAMSDASPLLISVPLYAAPESLVRPARHTESRSPATGELGSRIDKSVDLYGIGEVLFYLIAGKPARRDRPETVALLVEKMAGPVRLRDAVPGVSGPTSLLVAELTDPDPTKRPASAEEVRDRLDRIASGLGA